MTVRDPARLLASRLREFDLIDPTILDRITGEAGSAPADVVGRALVRQGVLTTYQLDLALAGRVKELVLGQYIILDQLGQGGTGLVLKARHRAMARLAAVKVIRRDLLAAPDAVQRFYREVEAVGRVRHPNIVEAYDAGPAGDTHFLAMEYIDGQDLSRLVKSRGPLPVAEAIDLVRQAALGLQHAHECGLVHRDVKPSNLLLSSRNRRVTVLDLGLARFGLAANTDGSSSLTEATGFIGTIDYVAPEQVENSHTVDHRADLYGLGATLYYLLTGRPPMGDGTIFQKISRLQTADPAAVETLRPNLSPGLVAVVRRLMARQVVARYQSAAEVLADLDRLDSPAALAAVPPAVPEAQTPAGPNTHADDSKTVIAGARTATVMMPMPSPKRGLAARLFADRRVRFAGGAGLLASLALGLLAVRPASPAPANNVGQPATAATGRDSGSTAAPPSPEQAKDSSAVPITPKPESRVQAVIAALKDKNPQFDGAHQKTCRADAVVALEFSTEAVTDLSPLLDLPELESLSCSPPESKFGQLTDLRPLRGLTRLNTLRVARNPVADLSPLAGLRLKALDCTRCTPLRNLTPLTRMTSLKTLLLGMTGVRDLKPLRRCPLTTLALSESAVSTLDDLRGLPLSSLEFHSTEVDDLSPLRGMTGLRKLVFAHTHVRDLSPLKGLRLTEVDMTKTAVADLTPLAGAGLTSLRCSASKVKDLSPLRGMPLACVEANELPGVTDLAAVSSPHLRKLKAAGTGVTTLEPLRGRALAHLNITGTRVKDLTPLANMKSLRELGCGSVPVADLSPLKGLGLCVLECPGIEVVDLNPLAGMPLRRLNVRGTRVTNLAALSKIASLESLDCGATPVTKLAPLVASAQSLKQLACARCGNITDWPILAKLSGLETVTLDYRPDVHRQPLRSLQLLRAINGQPAAQVLKDPPPK